MSPVVVRAVLSAALLAALFGDPWPAPVYLPSEASFNRVARLLKEAKAREQGFERARRDLTAGVSHDRRTPLTAALALIEAVADGVVDP